MKIGACVGTNAEKARILKKLGYDYFETNCRELVSMPMEKIDELKATGLPALAANCFISLRVVGEERDGEKLRAYVERLFERANYLGTEVLVFGSAGARRIPEGTSLAEGRAQIVDFLKRIVAPVAERYGLPVAIEPLNVTECNAVNTVEDGLEIMNAVSSPCVRLLADAAHMYKQSENFEKLRGLKGALIHAHTSNPAPESGRVYPKRGDAFKQESFLEPLLAAGVERCSVEAGCGDFVEDAAEALEVLKKFR